MRYFNSYQSPSGCRRVIYDLNIIPPHQSHFSELWLCFFGKWKGWHQPYEMNRYFTSNTSSFRASDSVTEARFLAVSLPVLKKNKNLLVSCELREFIALVQETTMPVIKIKVFNIELRRKLLNHILF